ncbi:enoyl-CoA hydratase/isomerase family protein [Pseudonocardia pini]|uniref:enoyl-CoA hydratase/isomerase family protein n=1 Tax=Pseudonocardia pini TaxID=2758030 RepID=UPI0015F0D905|nr:enoyl-CoA hydratase-related protein [Pseudonocardia pini]
MSEEIVVTVEGRVHEIRINRPEKRNALNRAAREGLFAAFRAAQADDTCRAVIVTGTGDVSFCAGADLVEMSRTGLTVPPKDFTPRLGTNVQLDKPVIAAVNGAAFAGGFLLAQMADLCVASENASFAITEAKWGRGAPWAIPLADMIPRRALNELLLTALPVTARRAEVLGLVNDVVPADRLLPRARELAQAICRNAPLTIAAHLKMVKLSGEMGRVAAEAVADELFRSVYESRDAQEGPAAFRERREPVWQGR